MAFPAPVSHDPLLQCLQEREDGWHHLSELVLFALSMQETLKHINTDTGNSFQLRVGGYRRHGNTAVGVGGGAGLKQSSKKKKRKLLEFPWRILRLAHKRPWR